MMNNPFKTFNDLQSFCSTTYLDEKAPAELFKKENEEDLLIFISGNLATPFDYFNHDNIVRFIKMSAQTLVNFFNLEFEEEK